MPVTWASIGAPLQNLTVIDVVPENNLL